MQEKSRARLIRILVNVVDAFCIKHTCPADDPMNFVSFGQQEFREIRAVLPCNSRDECAFHL